MKTHPKDSGEERGGFYADATGVGIGVTPEELKRVRALYSTILIAQAFGGIAALLLLEGEDWWMRLGSGALLACLPGFVFGLPIQAHFYPGTFSQHRGLICRIGFLAFLGTAMGAFVR